MNEVGALRIGTRGSQLALWQARTVARGLEASGIASELVVISTSGDRLQDAAMHQAGGKRLFVKEIEEALMRGEIDIAVHSAKDMPATLPDGLDIAACLPREDPRDVFVIPNRVPPATVEGVLAVLGPAPKIGTSSVRRMAQLATLVRGAAFVPIRGNVDTRLRKLDGGGYDALVLAAAGMRRLGMGARIASAIAVEDCVPAPGQGIIAIEIRSVDERTRTAVAAIHDRAAGTALTAERALVTALGGGCQLPLGGIALDDNGQLIMHAVVAAPDGTRAIRRTLQGPSSDPAALGRRVAADLSSGGATEILDTVRTAQGPFL